METSWTLPVPKHKFSDLYLCFCGYEACQPFHSYGPAVRPNYVIHYIISGKRHFYHRKPHLPPNRRTGLFPDAKCPHLL